MRSAVASALSAALLATPCLAGNAPEVAGDAPEARGEEADGLGRLLAGMARSAGFEAHFVEEVELALLREPLRSEGTLYFVPPDRMARFTRRPRASALLIDGRRMEYRDADGSRVDLSQAPMARHFADNLLPLFSGDRAALEDRYTVHFEAHGEHWKLALEPRHPPLSRAIVRIALEGSGARLLRMDVQDGEGARTVTRLRGVRSDRAFAPAELETLFEAARPLPEPDAGP